MKKILLLTFLLHFTICSYAQNTIKFLGIPVDGTKKEMISKLEAKGYEYNSYVDCLEGEFNGKNVLISIQTVNNRVWRICIIDASSTDEANIKIRFNQLYDQFLNNGKYHCLQGNRLDENDNISYQMTVNKKRYDATFGFLDSTINGFVWYMIKNEEYGKYSIVIFYENEDNAANGDDL